MVNKILRGSPHPSSRTWAVSSGVSVSVKSTAEVLPMGWKKIGTGQNTGRTILSLCVIGREKVHPPPHFQNRTSHNSGNLLYLFRRNPARLTPVSRCVHSPLDQWQISYTPQLIVTETVIGLVDALVSCRQDWGRTVGLGDTQPRIFPRHPAQWQWRPGNRTSDGHNHTLSF